MKEMELRRKLERTAENEGRGEEKRRKEGTRR